MEKTGREIEVRDLKARMADFEDGGRGLKARTAGGLQKLEKSRKQILPLIPQSTAVPW